MTGGRAWVFVFAALAAGCGGPPASARGPGADGGAPPLIYSGSVDGDRKDVLAEIPEKWGIPHILTTEFEGGRDQGCVLLLDGEGRILASHRFSGRTPYVHEDGGPIVQVQAPRPNTLLAFDVDGRRLLPVLTHGGYSPASWVLLELTPGRGLEERAVVWNFGHLFGQAHEGGLVAAAGLNNREVGRFVKYGTALLVLDLAEALAGGAGGSPLEVVLPQVMEPGAAVPPPVRWFLEIPLDHPQGDLWGGIEFRDGDAVVTGGTDLAYALDPATGAVRVEAGPRYRKDWPVRRKLQPELPERVEDPLDGLARRVRVHGRPR